MARGWSLNPWARYERRKGNYTKVLHAEWTNWWPHVNVTSKAGANKCYIQYPSYLFPQILSGPGNKIIFLARSGVMGTKVGRHPLCNQLPEAKGHTRITEQYKKQQESPFPTAACKVITDIGCHHEVTPWQERMVTHKKVRMAAERMDDRTR